MSSIKSASTVEWVPTEKEAVKEHVGEVIYVTDGHEVRKVFLIRVWFDQELSTVPYIAFQPTHFAEIPLPSNLPKLLRPCEECRWYREFTAMMATACSDHVETIKSRRCVHERYGTRGMRVQPQESCTDWEKNK